MGNESSSFSSSQYNRPVKSKRHVKPTTSKSCLQKSGSLKNGNTRKTPSNGHVLESRGSMNSCDSPTSQEIGGETSNGSCSESSSIPVDIKGARRNGAVKFELAGAGSLTTGHGYVKHRKSSKLALNNPNHLPNHFPRPNLHQTTSNKGSDLMSSIEERFRVQDLNGGESVSPPEEEDSPGRKSQIESRKNSLGERTTLGVAATNDSRKRSRSLCTQQLQADCQIVAAGMKQLPIGQGISSGRKASSGIMPSLARLRIQQCFKNARPAVGSQILKRACSLRSEIKSFMNMLGEEKLAQLASEIHIFVTESVGSIDDPERISFLSRTFGQKHAQLSNYGFRPEFFSILADATIAECVRLDGGTHKRCETLLAWSQLMQFMFSNVRDGYYAEIRQQRRSSLPQHKLLIKQGSMDLKNMSFDMNL